MLRTIVVTVAGAILSVLLTSVATYLMLHHTQLGHLFTGDTRGINDPWKVFASGFWVLFFCVSLPTIILVAIFVGALTKKHAPTAAAIAVLPMSVIPFGLELKQAWVTVLLVLSAILVAALMQRLRRLSPETQNNRSS